MRNVFDESSDEKNMEHRAVTAMPLGSSKNVFEESSDEKNMEHRVVTAMPLRLSKNVSEKELCLEKRQATRSR